MKRVSRCYQEIFVNGGLSSSMTDFILLVFLIVFFNKIFKN